MDLRHRARLSSSAEELELRLLQRAAEQGEGSTKAFDCDVLIVGSGYGGAVSAARLAGRRPQAGTDEPTGPEAPALRVWVLERGLERPPGGFPSRFAEVPRETRWRTSGAPEARGADEGLFDWHLGSDACALVASGLGGGSLINAGVMARPDASVWDTGWPAGINDGLEDSFVAAEAMLQPRKVPPGRSTPKFDSLKRLGGSTDLHERCRLTINTGKAPAITAAGVELAACTRCGDCASGCNVGAKGSLDTQYLALARQRGAEFFCGAEAIRVEPIGPLPGKAGWQLHWRYTRRSTRAMQQHTVVTARRVILAAGTLGSTGIVLRSREALGLGDERPLGRRFSGNGDGIFAITDLPTPARAVGDPESDPAILQPDRAVGPTITGQLRCAATDTAPAFVVQDFAIPAALRGVMAEIVATQNLFGSGVPENLERADPFAARDASTQTTAVFGIIGDDGAAGHLVLESSAPGAAPTMVWPANARPTQQRTAIRAAIDQRVRALRAGDGDGAPSGPRALHGSAALRQDVSGLNLPMITVHPLGGLCMADDGARGVVNAFGQVFAGAGSEVLDGLCVLDGAIVPKALGINPTLTITALAERALRGLAVEWKLGPEPGDATPDPAADLAAAAPPKARIERRHEIVSGPPTWVMAEVQHGALRLDGRHWWARLRVHSEPIPGFALALQMDRRVLALQSATLMLHGPFDDAPDEFSLGDAALARPDCEVQLAGSILLFGPLPEDDGEGRPADRIVYRLTVQATGPGVPPPFRPGVRLEGVKTVHRARPDGAANLWRALTELELSLNGMPVGRMALDLGDLEQRGSLLVQATRLANLPDALADLGSAGLYLLRRGSEWMIGAWLEGRPAPTAPEAVPPSHPRWPGALRLSDGEAVAAEIAHPETREAPWRLTRYAPSRSARKAGAMPVLLIHGLGMSGIGFTHPALPVSLAGHLVQKGREVWVLDLRSSIANHRWRRQPEAAQTSVEAAATADIPAALAWLAGERHVQQVDVVAHCMGAVSFILAALAPGDRLNGRVRRVVLSQVSPVVRLGAANRLRGMAFGHLRRLLQVDELDATPEFRFDADTELWQAGARSPMLQALDAVLATFPFGTQDDTPAHVRPGDRHIRLRADAIYGQLFEGANLSAETWRAMASLFGWAKMSMLSQALNLLRLGLVADRVNHRMRHGPLTAQFGFPLLMLHGQRNRVFDWRGSFEGWRMLSRLRGLEPEEAADAPGTHRLYGAGSSTRLAVFPGYGHLDSLIGQSAARDVFPVIDAFLDEPADGPIALPEDRRPAVEAEALDLGPMLGWLASRIGPDGDHWLDLTLGVHLTPRRASTVGLALVPVIETDGRSTADLDRARWLPWTGGQRLDRPSDRHRAVLVRVRARALQTIGPRFAVLSLHRDLPLAPAAPPPVPAADVWGATHFMFGTDVEFDWSPAVADAPSQTVQPEDWLAGGGPLFPGTRRSVQAWLDQQAGGAVPEDICFELGRRAQRAADIGRAYPSSPSLCFALASCQYPPGLFDREPAQAALAALAADARSADGPQFVLLVGDQVYADADGGVFDPAAGTAAPELVPSRFEHAYRTAWRLPAWRAVSQRIPVLPMLDDHEVRDFWQGRRGRTDAQLTQEEHEGLAAYARLQGLLSPSSLLCPASGAGSYTLAPAGVPICVLDTRSQRTARRVDQLDTADLLGDGEFAALLDWLDACEPGAVKLLVSPVALLPPPRLGHPAQALLQDDWSGFPGRTAALLRHIHTRKIRGLVLLSGDMHLSSVCRWRFTGPAGEGAPDILSVVSSGLYTPFPFANAVPGDAHLDDAQALSFQGPGDEAPVVGRLQCLALHAGPAWARVRIVPPDAAQPMTRLDVSLCGVQGSVQCRIPLDLPRVP